MRTLKMRGLRFSEWCAEDLSCQGGYTVSLGE
jgi:hypothetical protein